MMKKTLFVAGGAALLLGLLFGRDAVSYVSTSISQIKAHVKESVPIEFEIERARDMITDITPQIHDTQRVIAAEEVEIDRLADQINALEVQLAKDERNIMRMKDDLGTNESYIYYSNVRYSRDRIHEKLASDFERFKSNDATLASLRKTLNAREKGVQAAKDKLDGMLAAKRQLEVDVANLQARLKLVEVAKTSANFKVDESQLSRTKQLVQDIETRIKVQERMLNNFAGEEPFDDIQIDEPTPTKDVTEEITEYFGGARPSNALVESGK